LYKKQAALLSRFQTAAIADKSADKIQRSDSVYRIKLNALPIAVLLLPAHLPLRVHHFVMTASQ
jgi:hypothetical protein